MISFCLRNLVFINFPVPRKILEPYVPMGLELDEFHGRSWVSFVGLEFLDTKFLGIPIPFQQKFAQVNLRFYVRRPCEHGERRGVVFLKEMVPKFMPPVLGRLVNNEPYVYRRVSGGSRKGIVSYRWSSFFGEENTFSVRPRPPAHTPAPNSLEYFLSHRLYSYTPQRRTLLSEVAIDHPVWKIRPIEGLEFYLTEREVPFPIQLLQTPSVTAFSSLGSPVSFIHLHRIRTSQHFKKQNHGVPLLA